MNPTALALVTLVALAGYYTVSASRLAVQASVGCECVGDTEFLLDADCTKYYVCDNGRPIQVECPVDLFFNPELSQCDFAYNVTDCIDGIRDTGCGSTGGPVTLPPSPTTDAPVPTTDAPVPTTDAPVPTTDAPVPTTDAPVPTTDAPVPTTDAPVPTTDAPVPTTDAPVPTTDAPVPTTDAPVPTTDAPGICPAEGIDQVPFPGDCSKYYLCVNGEPNEMECADGTLFDEELKKCNLAEQVECKVDPTTTPAPPTTEAPVPTTTEAPVPTTEGPAVTCPPTGIIQIPDPTDCQKYYLCVEGEPISQECADGTLFDPESGKCALEEEVTCTVEPVCPAEGIAYLPVQGSCIKYVLCVEGTGLPMECAAGTEFDPAEGRCVVDSAYECPFAHRRRPRFYYF